MQVIDTASLASIVAKHNFTDAQLLAAKAQLGDVNAAVSAYAGKVGDQPPSSFVQSAASFGALARASSDAEWIAYCRTGALEAPVALSPRQLEGLRGGAGQVTGFGYYLFTGDICFVGDNGGYTCYSYW